MAARGDLLSTIEAVHAAGLDPALWPRALEAIARTIGGHIATIEAFDKRSLQHRLFLHHGMPPLHQVEYLDHYAVLNLRVPAHARGKVGDVIYDYAILDDEMMRRAPFYAEFLPRFDCRYFVAGIIASSQEEFAAVTVQRSPRDGHIDRAGIAAMKRLVPHVRQAFDVARRLKGASDGRQSLERALDWLADGVVLIRADGAVVYANETFRTMARRGDGIRLHKGAIEFASSETRDRFNAAIAAAVRLRGGDGKAVVSGDFVAARGANGPSYFISVRPVSEPVGAAAERGAIAAVFVRDPLGRNVAPTRTLREIFGLTEAEASLAQALQAGTTLADYARTRSLTLNTVYTHLRRLREKTGCRRMQELIRKLNDLHVPLRAD